jgi:hypothetical protein
MAKTFGKYNKAPRPFNSSFKLSNANLEDKE